MLLQVILEGLGLGALLALVCAEGIRKGRLNLADISLYRVVPSTMTLFFEALNVLPTVKPSVRILQVLWELLVRH